LGIESRTHEGLNLSIVTHCEGRTGELDEKQAAATYKLETVSIFASR